MAPKTGKCRTISEQRAPTKDKGAGKGKKTFKKSSKPVVVVNLDSEDLVDFPNYHPNQPHKVPTEIPQDLNPPADAPVKEQQDQEHLIDAPIEGPPHPETFQQET